MLHCISVGSLHTCIKEQISTGVFAVAQACCEPVLQSSTAQWESCPALTSVALHFCWFTAHLYEEQTFTCVSAVTQACCEPVFKNNTEQWE